MSQLVKEIQQIDKQIHSAMQAIDRERKASIGTKEAVHRLVEGSEKLVQSMKQQSRNPSLITTDVDKLEELADKAKAMAKQDSDRRTIQPESFKQVLNAHNSVSHLKSELHTGRKPSLH